MHLSNVIDFPGAPFLEVIFRLGKGVATTLVLPRAEVEGAEPGKRLTVNVEEGQFEGEVLAMRPVWEK